MDLFTKRYPFIQGELVRLGGTAMVSRILTEAQAGASKFDVAVGVSPSYPPMREKNLIAPYRPSESAQLYQDLYDPKGYWTTAYLNTLVLGYNTKIVSHSGLPKSYEDLIKPQWKGKLVLDIENFDLFYGLMEEWGKEKATAYLKNLAQQEPVFLRGNTSRANMISVGERPFTIVYSQVIERMKASGAPVDWIALEPVMIEINVAMLSSKAAHPNAGKLYIDFLVSKEAQEFLKTFKRLGPRKDVKPEPPRLFEGFKRRVIQPESYKNLREISKLHHEALGIK